jgi:alpha-tubulin suppressor-like RCC1 family protein
MATPYLFQQKKDKRIVLLTNVRRTATDLLADTGEAFCVLAPRKYNLSACQNAPGFLPFYNTSWNAASGYASMPGIITNVGNLTTFDPRRGTFKTGGSLWFTIDSNTLFRSICSYPIPWDPKTGNTMSIPFDLLANIDSVKFRSFREPVTAIIANPSDATVNLYACGKNNYGQLGNITAPTTARNLFYTVSGNWIDVVPGFYSSYALSSNNCLFATGDNSKLQLGLTAKNTDYYSTFTQVISALTYSNELINNPIFDKVSAGAYHAMALSGKKLFTVGSNTEGQLGTNKGSLSSAPVFFLFDSVGTNFAADFDDVVCGQYFTYALSGKTPFRTGLNSQGQLGTGDFTLITQFSAVNQYVDASGAVISATPQFDSLVAGASHAMALSGNRLLVVGDNNSGELGLQSNEDVTRFTLVTGYSLDDVTTANQIPQVDAVACGTSFSAFLSSGRLFVTGSNARGQLGLNDTNNRNIFTLVDTNSSFNSVACGYQYMLAISGRTLFGTGNNTNSEMSLPSFYRYLTLEPVLTAVTTLDKVATTTSTTFLSAPQGINYYASETLPSLTGWYYHRTPAFYAVRSQYYPSIYSLGFNVSALPTIATSAVFLNNNTNIFKKTNVLAFGSIVGIGTPNDNLSNSEPKPNAGSMFLATLTGEFNYRYKNLQSVTYIPPLSSPYIGYTSINSNLITLTFNSSSYTDARFGSNIAFDEKYMYVAAPTLSGVAYNGTYVGQDILSAGAVFVYVSPLTASSNNVAPVAILRPRDNATLFGSYIDCNYNPHTKISTLVSRSNFVTYVFEENFEAFSIGDSSLQDVSVANNILLPPYRPFGIDRISTILVAASPSYNLNSGILIVKNKINSNLTDYSYFVNNPKATPYERFGASVCARDKYLAVGVPDANINGVLSAGRVDIFTLSGNDNNITDVPVYAYRYSLSSATPSTMEQFGKNVHIDFNTKTQYISGELYMGDSLLVNSNSGCYLYYRYGQNFLYSLSSANANSFFEKSTLVSVASGELKLGTVYQTLSS